jgi:energy-converting hydrogenase Eha subunit E
MKSKLNVLFNIREYCGTYSIIIGKWSSLLILGIWDCLVKCKNTISPFQGVVLILDLTKKNCS